MSCREIKYKLLIVCAVVMTMMCCSPDTTVTVIGTGRIVPQVTVDASVYDGSGQLIEKGALDIPDVGDFSLLISSTGGIYRHIWQRWTDYDPSEGLAVGSYDVVGFYGDSISEGFDKPYYMGARRISVMAGEETSADVVCSLANTVFKVCFDDAVGNYVSQASAIFHSGGGAYLEYPAGEDRMLYVKQGPITMLLDLTLADGRRLRFIAATLEGTKKGHVYDVAVGIEPSTAGVPVVEVSFGEGLSDNDVAIELTEEFINSPAPSIVATGFRSGEELIVKEGMRPASTPAISVGTSRLQRFILDISASASGLESLPQEIDLAHLTPELSSKLDDCGIAVTAANGNLTVDFASMISRLRVSPAGASAHLSMIAVGETGKVSQPVSLDITVENVDIVVAATACSIVGSDRATVKLTSPVSVDDNFAVELFTEKGEWRQTEKVGVKALADSEYLLTFVVPEGETPVSGRLLYCGHVVSTFNVIRESPEFSIAADAFALKAIVTVVPEDASQLEMITAKAHIYANGELLTVASRDVGRGIIEVTGLKANSRYDLCATVFDLPRDESDFTQPVAVQTERAIQLPNSSFEEVKETIKYNNMPSGGRYSQSIVPIYNQQNRQSFEVYTPKSWATTNSKTFCPTSKNFNTWYLQPSVSTVQDCYSGAYAVKLQSTAFDPDGEQIAEYLQESQPYVGYSRVIPSIRYRAAGKMFLGSYSYDATTNSETYENRISFTSRPSALNGFYKYLPSKTEPSDRGMVTVEIRGMVDGELTVIASGTGYFSTAPSYTAFSVPLEYRLSNVAATEMSIMFASTEQAGTIEYETSNILTFNNPVTATSLGSELWLDEISLSY